MQTHQDGDDDDNGDYHHNAATSSSHSLHSPLHLNVPHPSSVGAGSSPGGMDYSPAPPPPAPPLLRFTTSSQTTSNKPSSLNILVPSNIPPPQFQRPTLHHANTITAASITTNSKSSFDSSFFSKLAAHSSSSTAKSSSTTTSPSRSRTRSADVPLSNKDVNAAPSIGLGYPSSNPKFSEKGSDNAASFSTMPMKKSHGLLRAASARPSLFAPSSVSPSTLQRPSSSASCRGSNINTTSSSNDENNPFKASPRPTVFMERAQSDSSLSFGNTFTRPNAGVRKPSNLGSGSSGSFSSASSSTTVSSTSTSATSRPSIVPFGGPQSTSQGRKISGR